MTEKFCDNELCPHHVEVSPEIAKRNEYEFFNHRNKLWQRIQRTTYITPGLKEITLCEICGNAAAMVE